MESRKNNIDCKFEKSPTGCLLKNCGFRHWKGVPRPSPNGSKKSNNDQKHVINAFTPKHNNKLSSLGERVSQDHENIAAAEDDNLIESSSSEQGGY